MNLDIRVFGPVEMRLDGRRVPLGTPKQLTLLAALVMAGGRLVSQRTLIDRIWDDEPPHAALSSLYTYVARLRRLFRSECPRVVTILRATTGYALEVDLSCLDLHRVREALSAARAAATGARDGDAALLYREALRISEGEPLCGLRGGWAERARAGLRQERLSALTGCFAAELRLGRHAEVIGELWAAVDEYPLDEVLAGQLMVSLHRSHRYADAVFAFHRIRADLADRLGISPGPPLSRLHAELLQ